MDQESIKKEAKQIMDRFMASMKDIDVQENFAFEKETCFREEKEGKELNEEFRENFLSNAPKSTQDSIMAKRGSWVEK